MADEPGGTNPLEQDEEKAVLMIRWQKLLKARDENEELAVQRSYENGRYSMFICCTQGKRRKRPPYDEAVMCDVCLGWIHKGCMSKHAWDNLGDLYICALCARLPPNTYEIRTVPQQNAGHESNENALMQTEQVAQQEAEKQPIRSELQNLEDSLMEEGDDKEEEEHSNRTRTGIQTRVATFPPAGNDNLRDHTASAVQNRIPPVNETFEAQSSFEHCGICQKSIKTFDFFNCACGLTCHTLCSYLLMPEPHALLECIRCQQSARTESVSSYSSDTTVVEVIPQKSTANSSRWTTRLNSPPKFSSTPCVEADSITCPCGKQVKTTVISCVKCSRFWHMSCVRKELLFGSDLICELCKNDDSLEERRRLAEPFLRAEERLSHLLAPTAVKGNAAPPRTKKIQTDDKRRPVLVCNACCQPATREKGFTKLACCKGCCRLLHTHCSGLPSVECLEWEECVDCQERRFREMSEVGRVRARNRNEPPQEESGFSVKPGPDMRVHQPGTHLCASDSLNKVFRASDSPRNKSRASEPPSKEFRASDSPKISASLGEFFRASEPPRYSAALKEKFSGMVGTNETSRRVEFLRDDEASHSPTNESPAHVTSTDPSWLEGIRQEIRGVETRIKGDLRAELESVFLSGYHSQPRTSRALDLLSDLPDPPRTRESFPHTAVAQKTKHTVRFRQQMTQSDDEKLLDYEEEQQVRAAAGLPADTVSSAAAKLAVVSLKQKPMDNEAIMKETAPPGESQTIKQIAEAMGAGVNRLGTCLNLVKEFHGNEGPEQVRRFFDEFELITRGLSNDERRDVLRVRVRGRAATALQLMPRDLLDDYEKIKRELLLRLADDEPRRSANLAAVINGCPRQPNESIEQFGIRVQKLVRDAMSPQCPLSQVDEIAKQYFTRWLNDEQLVPSLIDQAEHKEFRYLVDHAANLRRNLDLYAPNRSVPTPPAATASNKGSRQQSTPGTYAKNPNQQSTGYHAHNGPPAAFNQQRNAGPSPQGNSAGNTQNAQQQWPKPVTGNFRNNSAGNYNSGKPTPSNAFAAQTAAASGNPSVLAQHHNKYTFSAPSTGQSHNTLSASLPISTMNTRVVGPCAIGPVPKKDVIVEGMPAVSLWDSGAPVSIVEAGYLRGLLEAKGVDPCTWPIDPPSTAISVANGHSLNCVGSTILHVSIGRGSQAGARSTYR